MTTTLVKKSDAGTSEQQYATFYVGDMLLGVDIRQVQEINRQLEVTVVPHSPDYVRGVINLRGNVSSVIDLHTILGLPEVEITRDSRNLVVHSQGESIGFLVDRISDVLTLQNDEITAPLENIEGIPGRLISGVHTKDTEILVILNIEEVLADRKPEE